MSTSPVISHDRSSPLLRLPREIRDQIYREVFFPREYAIQDLTQDYRGLGTTAVRQIQPYLDKRDAGPLSFDTALIRTCKQLQLEAEEVLYGLASWNLMYRDWESNIFKLSFELFQSFPRRLRRHIRAVERKCYSVHYDQSISLFDWTAFMTFLARECPNLQLLKLWGPGDSYEAAGWVESCKKDAEWVQAILQIKSLRQFDIPMIPGGKINQYPEFTGEFLPWLKTRMIGNTKPVKHLRQTTTATITNRPFPFLKLSKGLRNLIYHEVLIPPDGKLHPYLKPWFDETTRNLIPLFLTCKQIREEAENLLYRNAIFCSPIRKYDDALAEFVESRIGHARFSFKRWPTRTVKYMRSDDEIVRKSAGPRYGLRKRSGEESRWKNVYK